MAHTLFHRLALFCLCICVPAGIVIAGDRDVATFSPTDLFDHIYELSARLPALDEEQRAGQLLDLYLELNNRPILAQVFPYAMESGNYQGRDQSILSCRASIPLDKVYGIWRTFDEKDLQNFDTYDSREQVRFNLADLKITIHATFPASNEFYDFDVTLPIVLSGWITAYRVNNAHLEIWIDTEEDKIVPGEVIDGKPAGFVHAFPTDDEKIDSEYFRSPTLMISARERARIKGIPMKARSAFRGGIVTVKALIYEDANIEFVEFEVVDPADAKLECAAVVFLSSLRIEPAYYRTEKRTMLCSFSVPFLPKR